ncbi:MAG: hypothetical protein OEQ25_14790 [Gammaproteobacteria bacterium]|nr:hypothetical protein [Gammaproteobacteria bacterium]
MINKILVLLAIFVAQAIPATAQSKEKDLDRWVDRDLVPFVRQQLIVHPRFKGETVMFVVLKDNVPAPVTNALALSLRDRLLDAAVDTPGVSIGWQQGRAATQSGAQSIDCSRDDVHYYIGLELKQQLDSSYAVTVRALDLEDRSWVTGFGKSWQGQLSTIERQAMRQSRKDSTFLGARDAPFSLAQTDLLAAHLAHELSCELLRGVEGEYVVEAAQNEPEHAVLGGTVELVSNNLANHTAIELSGDVSRVNASLSGKAHAVDGPLYQYWLTLTPIADVEGVSALSTSAYVLLPGYELAQNHTDTVVPAAESPPALVTAPRQVVRASVSMPNAGKDALLGPLRIVTPSQAADCMTTEHSLVRDARYWPGRRACSLLTATANSDAIVFFLEHQANHGLVRLGGPDCRARTAATIARSDAPLQFPIPQTASRPRANETYEWLVTPDRDTFYAVAVSDARAARSIANHMDKLPMRCSEAMRSGLRDTALQSWLDEFATLAAHSSKHFDWRAIVVTDVL